MMRFSFLITLTILAVLSIVSNSGVSAKPPDDVIANVGNQIITLKQIDVMINHIGQHFFACSTITPQSIDDDSARCVTQAF